MNGADLLKGLSYIAEDHIEEAETVRLKSGNALLGWVSAAACLCLLVTLAMGRDRMTQPEEKRDESTYPVAMEHRPAGGASTQPDDRTDPSFHPLTVQSVQTAGILRGTEPVATVVHSRQALQDYCSQVDRGAVGEEFRRICGEYDEAYFEERGLILAVLTVPDNTVACRVTDLRETDTGWVLAVTTDIMETAVTGQVQWILFLEIPIGKSLSPESTVTVEMEGE